ncbi:MAG: hypothetical protein QOI42_267 [Frankiaceae bacterium]|nr:hypothetical protein [Frankiaceae bacterium]
MSPTHAAARAPARAVARRRLAVAVAAAVLVAGGGGAYALHRGGAGPTAPLPPPTPIVEVRAGQTADTVAHAMESAAGWSAAAVEAAMADPSAAGVPGSAPSVEGWLGVGVYPVSPTDTPASLVARMVVQQRAAITASGLGTAAARQHRSINEMLTIASVAQAEAIPSQYGQVARVVDNRLAAGMPLQMDATLNYANKTHVLAHSVAQLRDPSAYNSYTHKGLPPTPIGNPDDRALAAAASPPQGPWLYFVLIDKDGTQLFTADYAEFEKAKAKAQAAGVF